MKRVLFAVIAAVALTGVMAADDWDGFSWVYTPETHRTVSPVSAESTTAVVDASYWTYDWCTGTVVLKPGIYLIIR